MSRKRAIVKFLFNFSFSLFFAVSAYGWVYWFYNMAVPLEMMWRLGILYVLSVIGIFTFGKMDDDLMAKEKRDAEVSKRESKE